MLGCCVGSSAGCQLSLNASMLILHCFVCASQGLVWLAVQAEQDVNTLSLPIGLPGEPHLNSLLNEANHRNLTYCLNLI